MNPVLRIFHYSPWYTYCARVYREGYVENLSLFTLVHLSDRVFPLVKGINGAVFREKNCPIPASISSLDKIRKEK